MKIFLDGADLVQIKQYKNKVKGLTTNPSLMKKSGITNYKDFALEVLKLTNNPVSFEVLSDDFDEMERQARIISSWGNNVYVKIPIINTKGFTTSPVVEKLSKDGIKLNITAIMTSYQVEHIFPYLQGDNIISVFAGRIADTGTNPIPIMKKIRLILGLSDVALLWASTREVYNVIQAIRCECDIITVTPEILKKMELFGVPLNEMSLRTVKQFYEDAKGLSI